MYFEAFLALPLIGITAITLEAVGGRLCIHSLHALPCSWRGLGKMKGMQPALYSLISPYDPLSPFSRLIASLTFDTQDLLADKE